MIVEPIAIDASIANNHGEGLMTIALIVMPPHNISSAVILDRRDTPWPFS